MAADFCEISGSVRVDNIQELKDLTHICTSQDLLNEIRLGVVGQSKDILYITGMIGELTAKLKENMDLQIATSREHMQSIIGNSNDIRDLKYLIPSKDATKETECRLKNLESCEEQKKGSGRWEQRVDKIIDGLVLLVIGAILIYFLKGGVIT